MEAPGAAWRSATGCGGGGAAKQGFRRALVPESNLPRRPVEGLEVQGVARLSAALAAVF